MKHTSEEIKNRLSNIGEAIGNIALDYIADLEKENSELKEKLERAERARDYWKDSSFDWRHKCTSRRPFRVAVKAQKQLTKAKELLKKFIETSNPIYFEEDRQKVKAEAEQFLNEVEK